MNKIKNIFIAFVLLGLLGCAASTGFVIKGDPERPEKCVLYKLRSAYFDGDYKILSKRAITPSETIFTTELPRGVSNAVVWCTVAIGKDDKITVDWYFEGNKVARFEFPMQEHSFGDVSLYLTNPGGMPSRNYKATVSVPGGQEESIEFKVL